MKVEIELEDLNELHERIERLELDLYEQVYMGNSIGYIYQKKQACDKQLRELIETIRQAVDDGKIDTTINSDKDEYLINIINVL